MIGYTCKYTPIELLNAMCAETKLVNSEAEGFDYTQDLTHINLCCHTKALIENIHKSQIKELVLINCCDSTRKAYDILKNEGMNFIFMLDLPHNDNNCAKLQLKNQLIKLVNEYSKYSGTTFDIDKFILSFKSEQKACTNDFIAVLGARVGDGLLEQLKKEIPMEINDFTCNNNRYLPKPIEMDFDELMLWYAGELLSQIPCMRMFNIGNRKELINNSNLKGIIYNTVKFCDYYSFEYEDIRKNINVPILKIETDFTMQALGQLSTRIGGFIESIVPKNKKISKSSGKYFAGIDSGSTTTNVVVIDDNGKIVDSAIVRTGAKAQNGAEKAFDLLTIKRDNIGTIIATGYGRNNISFAHDSYTEITCHAKGANNINKKVRTIIDIGGQDSKVISIDENGNVKNFAMNDKCAAGTGRFLENMAKVLEINIDEMSIKGLRWKEDLTISSICTVFAESEVVSLIADNKSENDIIHGLNKSVASKTSNLLNRIDKQSEILMTGGVARNKGVVKALCESTEQEIFVPEHPDLCGALGAALFALENSK